MNSRRRASVGIPVSHGRAARWTAVCCGLLLAHAACIAWFGVRGYGPLISALFLLAEGTVCVIACYDAATRSGPLGRHFWYLATLSFVIWVVAELIGTVQTPGNLDDLLFQFATLPLGMTLFLENGFRTRSARSATLGGSGSNVAVVDHVLRIFHAGWDRSTHVWATLE